MWTRPGDLGDLPTAGFATQYSFSGRANRPAFFWGNITVIRGGCMHTHDDVQTAAPRQIGRRAVTRGAAWSIPVVSLAVAAPAMAATSGSPCTVKTGKVVWSSQANGNLFGKVLTTAAGVNVTVTAVGDTGAANNGVKSTGPIGNANSLLLLHSQNGKNNTTQTITIKFSAKVKNLSFTLLDIDSSRTVSIFGTVTNHWQDKISIQPAPSSQTRGSTVQGNGSAGTPWRATTTNTPVADNKTTGNVAVSWATALDTITIVYSQDGSQDGSPKVGISDLSFQTVCP
jgi:hypothetical protein